MDTFRLKAMEQGSVKQPPTITFSFGNSFSMDQIKCIPKYFPYLYRVIYITTPNLNDKGMLMKVTFKSSYSISIEESKSLLLQSDYLNNAIQSAEIKIS